MKAVFDQHQEEYNPADWENMRKKLGKKSNKKIVILFPFIAKAASVILFIGFSVFYVNQNLNNQKNKEEISSIDKLKYNDSIFINTQENQNNLITKKDLSISNNHTQSDISEKNNISKENQVETELTKRDEQNNKINVLPMDSSKLILANIKEVLQNHRDSIQKMTNTSIKNANEKKVPELVSDENFEDSKKKQEKFEFGVELASVSNYSTDANGSNLNIGGGFSAGYKITKNMSISSGMVIAKHSLDYSGTEDTYIPDDNRVFAEANSINIIDKTSIKSNVSFVTLDIPLNLSYRIKNIILSTGVSSLIFINESYSSNYDVTTNFTTYNTANASFETTSTVQNISKEESNEVLNHFDFAGLFNLSVAYDIPLNKGSLAFEPYVKLPLASIGSYNVTMGSGGLKMRYNF
jgi:hypothetical protein